MEPTKRYNQQYINEQRGKQRWIPLLVLTEIVLVGAVLLLAYLVLSVPNAEAMGRYQYMNIYQSIQQAVINHEEKVPIPSGMTSDDILDIIDMPYLVEGDGFEYAALNPCETSVYTGTNNYVDLGYWYSANDVTSQRARIERHVRHLLKDIKGLRKIEKIGFIYRWIGHHIDYDDNLNESSWSVYSAAVNRRGVCVSFASLFRDICKEAGISTRSCCSASHVWTKVRYSGHWYNIDPTTDDGYVGYAVYFMVSDKEYGNLEQQDSPAWVSPVADSRIFDNKTDRYWNKKFRGGKHLG